MNNNTNHLGQPIGFPVYGWQLAAKPTSVAMVGQYCTLLPLDPDAHLSDLFDAFQTDINQHNWTYLPYGPFDDIDEFKSWLTGVSTASDPYFYSIVNQRTGKAVGIASYLRINPLDGVIEVGHIHFSPLLQRTPLATEAMYLMMHRVFDELGYRRYEWKCDALNEPSRRAAVRFGFQYEGTFRQMTMYKGRNRDTAWFSMLDHEWSNIKRAYEGWLSPKNFNESGVQRCALKEFTKLMEKKI
jgi:RimJ/RimL family protein N-acetyltransferase